MALPGRPGPVCEFEPERAGATARADWQVGAGFRWAVLPRHGRRPLAVLGRALLRADNRCTGLACWSEITIHETAAHRFVAALSHTLPAAFGPAWRDAWLCDSAEAVRGALRGHDPLWALPLAVVSDRLPGAAAVGPADADAVSAARFLGAWAGLLGAVFGLPVRSGGGG